MWWTTTPVRSNQLSEHVVDTTTPVSTRNTQIPSWMKPHKLPSSPFDIVGVCKSEITNQLMQSRNSSPPCPYDQISYKILKKCPSVVEALMNIDNHCLYHSAVTASWKAAVNMFLIWHNCSSPGMLVLDLSHLECYSKKRAHQEGLSFQRLQRKAT